MIKEDLNQGDIIKIDSIKTPVLIVSKDFFNRTGEAIGCPVFLDGEPGALHIYISTKRIKGYVQCEKLKLFDFNVRGYHKVDHILMQDIINITDAIQGIFDYI